MVSKLKDLWNLACINKKLKAIQKKSTEFRNSDIYKKLSTEEKLMEDSLCDHELQRLWEDIERIKHKRFIRKLLKYNIPIPPKSRDHDDKYWVTDCDGHQTYFSTQGYYELSKMIREVIIEQREASVMWWVPMIATAGGFVLGVLSLIKNWNN